MPAMTLIQTDKEAIIKQQLNEIILNKGIAVRVNDKAVSIPENSRVTLDIEHDESGTFVGCGIISDNAYCIYYFSDIRLLRCLPFHTFSIVAHNGKGDIEALQSWGLDVSQDQLVHDTELMAHILDSSRKGYGLKKLAKECLNIEYPSYDDIVGKHKGKTKKAPKCPQIVSDCCGRITLDKWPIEIVSKYNALDVYCTHKLYELQRHSLPPVSSVIIPLGGYSYCPQAYFEQLEKPTALAFAEMENRGVRIDRPYLLTLKDSLEAQRRPLEEVLTNELGSINLDAPKQLLEAFQAKGIRPEFKGKASMDQRGTLNTVFSSEPLVKTYKEWNELNTLLTSFVYSYLDRQVNVVHPFFNQCGTRTGRVSCSNPNLLQIPRRTANGKLVRRMFIPRDGMLMGACDFGQIEPRVLAHLSQDPVLCQMFNDGVDFHTYTADRLGISRERAKILNLSVGYRATFKSVMAQLKGTKDEAQAQIDAWWSLFPALRRWQDELIYDAKRSGFCTTLLGRRIKVDNLNVGNSWQREAAERQLINNITQGSAAEIMKMAMIKINGLAPRHGLLIQIYDELVFEAAEDLIDMISYSVIACMQNSIKLRVPLTVDCKTGTSWSECH